MVLFRLCFLGTPVIGGNVPSAPLFLAIALSIYGRQDHATGGVHPRAITVRTTPQYRGMPSESRIYRSIDGRSQFSSGIRIANCCFCKSCDTIVDKNRGGFKTNCCIFLDTTAASPFARFRSVFTIPIFARFRSISLEVFVQFSYTQPPLHLLHIFVHFSLIRIFHGFVQYVVPTERYSMIIWRDPDCNCFRAPPPGLVVPTAVTKKRSLMHVIPSRITT